MHWSCDSLSVFPYKVCERCWWSVYCCKLDLVEQAPTSGCLKCKVSDTGTVTTHKQQVHIQVLIMWHVMNLLPTLVVKLKDLVCM